MCSLGTPVEGDVSIPYRVYLPIKWGRHPEGQVSTVTLYISHLPSVLNTSMENTQTFPLAPQACPAWICTML